MSALWMVYAAALSLLLSAAAWSGERALRLLGRSTRGVWAAALVASLALPAYALLGPAGPASAPSRGIASSPASVAALRSLSELGLFSAQQVDLAGRTMLAAWLVLAGAALTLFALGVRHVARERRRWPVAIVAGERVRVAESFGPAVVGAFRPEIVIPRWMLALDDESLRLVMRHEREHLRARDTLLLSAGYLAAAASAWNPVAWLQLRRLRLSTEVDCDRRVLQGGADRRRYGELLIRVGARESRAGLAAAALTEPTSFLERRIRVMTERSPRLRGVRAALAAALTVGLGMVACDVPAPTQPAPPAAEAVTGSLSERVAADDAPAAREQPAIFVDGVRLTGDVQLQLARLEPNDIRRIEIVKGTAAAVVHPDDPQAANGVIYVFTKRGRSDGR